MRILVIGGTGFIGPHLVRQLASMGHSVSVLHRGNAPFDLPAEEILGNRNDLAIIRPKNRDVASPSTAGAGGHAGPLWAAFGDVAGGGVAPSIIDVYRAGGALQGREGAPLNPPPPTKAPPPPTKLKPSPPQQIKMLQ